MRGEFLKEAQRIDDENQTTSEIKGLRLAYEYHTQKFAIACWPEILAVVEAAEDELLDGPGVKLPDALDALDKKASEL